MRETNIKVFISLLIIMIIAVGLRLWSLGHVPASLDWDEASLGYNAFSILQTGKDEYGKAFPIILESLGDFKPALYVYLIIPFIKLFGLNEMSIRLPAVIFGSLTVLTTYFIALELFKRRKIALVSSFLLAVSPWSIQFSRFASEAMIGLSLNLLMVLFFLKAFRRPWMLVLSAIFGALALYSYQSEKVFLPLLILSLIIIYFKNIIKIQKKYIISAIFIFILISLPLAYSSLTNTQALNRAKDTSFLNKPNGVMTDKLSERLYYDVSRNDLFGKVFDNRRVVYGKEILNNYLSHFDLNYLFLKGDVNPRHKAPGMGNLYLIELPFLLLGLYFLISRKFNKESKLLIITWMLITPVAASVTWEVPHSIRSLNFLPTFQIITAIGIVYAYEYVRNKKWNRFINYSIFGCILVLAVFNFVYYLNQYFVQYNYFNSSDWQYGYAQLVPEVEKVYDQYDKIIVSDEKPFDQSYIFFLYNLKFPPKKYLQEAHSSPRSFDKFVFRKITNEDFQRKNSRTLIIGRPGDFPGDGNLGNIKTIYFLNGEEMGRIVSTEN